MKQIHQGDLHVVTDGTVIENLDIQGSIVVHARNVTVKDSVIRGSYKCREVGGWLRAPLPVDLHRIAPWADGHA